MSQPIVPWASAPNYPPGGNTWSGTPTKVAPAITYLTPNVPMPAQVFNYLLNQRDSILGNVAMATWAAAAANWTDPIYDLNGQASQNSPVAACWDGFSGQWIVISNCPLDTPFDMSLLMSYDGKTWQSIASGIPGSATRVPWAVATNPDVGDLVILRSDGSTSSITRWAGGTGSGTDTVQAFLGGSDQGVLVFFNGAFWFVGATGIGTSTWTGHAATSATGAGAWTDATSSLPVGWASSGSNFVLQWLAVQNGTDAVFAMCGNTPGTDTSRLMSLNTSGTFTDITPSVLGGTSKELRGLAYSENDALWGILAVDTTNSYLYTSPDLVTWTLVHTFTGYIGVGVATIGSCWTVMAWNGTLGQGGTRILLSVDVATDGGSSSWVFGGYCEGNSGQAAIPAFNPAGLLLSNGQQILRCEILRVYLTAGTKEGGAVAVSQIAGFSGNVPIAPVITGPSVGWNTALDIDFSLLPSQSIGSDGLVTLAGLSWNKVRSANDRAALAVSPSNGLVFQPVSNTTTGGGLFLALAEFIPASALFWSTSVRFWVYIQGQNFTNNGDELVMAIASSPTSTSPLYEAYQGQNGGNPVVQVAVSTFTNHQVTLTGGFSGETAMVLEVQGLDQLQESLMTGIYGGGAWPTEGALQAALNAKAGSSTIQDPSSGSAFNLNNLGILLYTQTGVGSTMTVTVGRIRVDYKL